VFINAKIGISTNVVSGMIRLILIAYWKLTQLNI
jgi:hypothetical protein